MSKMDVRNTLAFLMLSISGIILIAILFYPVPERNIRLIDITLGVFLGNLASIIGYYFSASKSPNP